MSLISARSGMTRLLDAFWCDGHLHQKAVVMLGGFVSHCVAQLNLFNEDAPHANGEVLISLMNEINQQD